jgi:hypothetical protein
MQDMKTFTEGMAEKMHDTIMSGQQALPMIFKVDKDDKITVIAVADMDDKVKDQVAYMLYALAQEPTTQFVVFMSDSWMKTLEPGEDRGHRQVRDIPGRREAIVATISGRGINPIVGTWAYDRDANGKPVFDPSFEWKKDGTALGRFVVNG